MADEAHPEQEQTVDEELLKALDRIGVADVLVQALATTASIGFRRVSAEARDLTQARLAIESLRALVPVLERGTGDAVARDFRQVIANLQLAYAEAAAAPASEPEADQKGGEEAAS